MELLKQLQEEAEKEEETEEEETEEEEEEEETEENTPDKVTADMTKVVNQLGEKLARAITEAKGEKDAKGLEHELFNKKEGFQAVKFPTLDELSNMKKAYKTSTNPDVKKEAGDNIIVSFFKAWVQFGQGDREADMVFRALVEGTAGDGGYLVPSPLAAEVWRVLPEITVMRKIARTMPMTALTLDLNSLIGAPQAYWVGEYAKKTTTSAEFYQRELKAFKLVCLLPASHELLADANIDLARFIVQLFAERLGEREDHAFFVGNGTTQPRGIEQETLSSVSGTDFDTIIDLIYKVSQSARMSPSAAFVGNSHSVRVLRKLKDDNGDYIWRDGGMFGGETGSITRMPATLYGYPFYEENHIGIHRVFFGDWRNYIIGDRQQVTVSKTDEGGDAWRRDATEFKAVERVGGRAAQTSGVFAEANIA